MNSTPEQLLVIQKIAKRLSYKFIFGYYSREDIEQEAIMMGLEGLQRYDSTQPFENFICTHMKNRLINFKRDNFERKNSSTCECGSCNKCTKRQAKKNILEPISIESIDNTNENNTYESSEMYDIEDIQNLVDENLPSEYREDYLKMYSGVKIPHSQKKKIESIIYGIIHDRT